MFRIPYGWGGILGKVKMPPLRTITKLLFIENFKFVTCTVIMRCFSMTLPFLITLNDMRNTMNRISARVECISKTIDYGEEFVFSFVFMSEL